jgi:hypothetical protein
MPGIQIQLLILSRRAAARRARARAGESLLMATHSRLTLVASHLLQDRHPELAIAAVAASEELSETTLAYVDADVIEQTEILFDES